MEKSLQSQVALLPFFQCLSAPHLERLVGQMTQRNLAKGERLYQQGEKGDSLAVLARGRLRVVVATPSGIEVTVGQREPGSLVGEMALLDGQPRSASLEATEPCEVWLLESDDFHRLLYDTPQFSRHLLRMLSARLREANTRIESLAHGSIRQRLAKFLADQAVYLGEMDGTLVRLPPFSAADLGSVLGLERRHVSRALNHLRTQGYVDGDGTGIVINDLQRLRELAQQVEAL